MNIKDIKNNHNLYLYIIINKIIDIIISLNIVNIAISSL